MNEWMRITAQRNEKRTDEELEALAAKIVSGKEESAKKERNKK